MHRGSLDKGRQLAAKCAVCAAFLCLAVPGAAGEKADAGAGKARAAAAAADSSLQRRCFCVRPTDNAFQPYLVERSTVDRRCDGAVYRPAGKAPWDNVLSCADLGDCYDYMAAYYVEKAAMKAGVSEAGARRERCPNPSCRELAASTLAGLVAALESLDRRYSDVEHTCFRKPLPFEAPAKPSPSGESSARDTDASPAQPPQGESLPIHP